MEIEAVNLPTVPSFRYLGSTIDRRGEASKDVKSRVAKAWSKWSDPTGVICDKKVPQKNEAPDIPDSDSTDVTLRLRNMAIGS